MDYNRPVVEVDRRARGAIWHWKTLSRSRSTAHRAHGRQRIHRQARRECETRGIVRARIERCDIGSDELLALPFGGGGSPKCFLLDVTAVRRVYLLVCAAVCGDKQTDRHAAEV